jgi:hypothetical protein
MRWISSLSEKPVHHRSRILVVRINLTGGRRAHSMVALHRVSVEGVFVKAAYGKTVRAV